MQRRDTVVCYLCTAFVAISAITVQTPKKIAEAPRGGSMALPCTYQTSEADRIGASVEWQKLPEENEVIAAFYGSLNHSDPSYEGRVSFTGNVFGSDASILIDKLTMEDNGTYQCEVKIPRDRTGTRQAKMDLIVLVAPSKPDCGIVGTAEYGQVITLTCNSKEGSPIPQYAWKSYTPQDVQRVIPQTAVIDGGQLTLKNISMDSSGFFICTSTNRIGEEFCNLTLAVMPPSMNIALYAGAIGGSVAGIIVIGIIVYCCCCRDKGNEEDYEMAEGEEDPDEPPQKSQTKQQQQQYYHDDEGDDDLEESNEHKPPMPPANKPRLVIDPVNA
ncbi:cell surface A33 antigen isoform X2 [Pseudophryne corroboree]|uniref:cell surface A33 antigen isoform X2 n=1 Tax=Pseudophryne corroboree TaxID=495146 RepID=UPI003081F9B7